MSDTLDLSAALKQARQAQGNALDAPLTDGAQIAAQRMADTGLKGAHILAVTIMAGGHENIDPASLVTGQTPRAYKKPDTPSA